MTKRFFSAIFVFALLFLAVGCGGNRYGDCVKLNEKFVQLMQDYVGSLEKATSAKTVAEAMNRFADGMRVLGPKLKEMTEKYPELKDKNNQPEALKASREKAEEVGKRMAGSFMKIMPYMRDPQVQAAQKRVAKAMTNMM